LVLSEQASARRKVSYVRHGFHSDDEPRVAPLAVFVLDVPYLISPNGFIPSRRVMNQVLSKGGGDAGMSPGASWEPFSLDEAEYEALLHELLEIDVSALSDAVRFKRGV
jgi:hypothetical protein